MQLQQEKQIAKSNLLRKCGLLAHASAAFLKNCCTEKLFVCLRLVIGNLTSRNISRIRFGKAEAHPQLAWESQLPLKPCSLITTSWFWRQLRFFQFSLRFLLQFYLQSLICFANVGCSPTPRQHFWKTAASKNFLFACGSYFAIFSENLCFTWNNRIIPTSTKLHAPMHIAPIRTMSATALPLPSTSSYAFLFGWSGKWSSMENETASTTAYRLPSALSSRLPVTSSESERGRFVPSAFQKQRKSSVR